MTLLLIGFIGGILAGISPCVLPVLPVILLGAAEAAPAQTAPAEIVPAGPAATGPSVAESPPARRRFPARPVLIVLGLTLSFSLITLFGTVVLSLLHLPTDLLRWLGLAALLLLGLSMLVPAVERIVERAFAWIPQRSVGGDRGGFVLGLALGAVFVPCAGPVLAAIAVAGATGRIGWNTVTLTVAFALGTAIPLLLIAFAGRQLSTRVRALQRRQRGIRAVAGVAIIALAVALTFNVTDVLQRKVPDYTQALGNSLGTDAAAVAVAGTGSLQTCQRAAFNGADVFSDCGRAPEITGISQWLNTQPDTPRTLAALRGKVVLIDFWAYSCINCQRELPHVEAWWKTYAPYGFQVIAVHTPEYAFERNPANVAAGARKIGLTTPIAIDTGYGTWNAYHNVSWPASYLIDATGVIRHVSIGEGDYPQQERDIRSLLLAAHPSVTLPKPTDLPDTTPDGADLTPETYLGVERQQYYGGTGGYTAGTHTFTAPKALDANTFGLGGTWTIGNESITAGSGAALSLSYQASKVYLDVGGTGTLTATEDGATRTIAVSGAPNIYTVASHPGTQTGTVTVGLTPGLAAYSFTFG
ncbi:redoxin domain-containing protein [Tsukamurella soli]|uniref:Cytochrome c biogenesis protein DipZ n=1 Tax=Tsukamurella soli TaxID=644556 RepID=A0ABP8JE04_9ACTN